MSLKSFNDGVVKFARPALITAKTVAVAAGGAALAGGTQALTQYLQANGASLDWHQAASVAAAGALISAGSYFLTPPHVSTK